MIGEYKVCQFLPSRHAPHARVRDEAASSTVDNLWEVCAMAESAARGHLPRPRESVTHWLAATSKHIDIIFLQASVYTSPEPSIGRHRPASAPPPVGNKLQGFSTSAYQSTPKLAFSMYTLYHLLPFVTTLLPRSRTVPEWFYFQHGYQRQDKVSFS